MTDTTDRNNPARHVTGFIRRIDPDTQTYLSVLAMTPIERQHLIRQIHEVLAMGEDDAVAFFQRETGPEQQ